MKRVNKFVGLAAIAVVLGVALSVFRNGDSIVSTDKPKSAAKAPVAKSAPVVRHSALASLAVATNQTATARGTLPFLVTSKRPIQVSQRESFEALGAKVVSLQSRKTVLVEATPEVRNRIKGDRSVEDVVEVGPSAKIQPALAELVNGGAKDVDISIIALAAKDRGTILGFVANNGGKLLEGCVNEGSTIRVNVPAEAVAKLASYGEVSWMEQFKRPQFLNDLAVKPAQMNVMEVWDAHGLTGLGQGVSTSDTGIDTGDLTTIHEDLRNQIKDIQISTNCFTNDVSGHGTHTAGSIVGNGTKSGGKIKGVAYEADLYAWFCGRSGGSVYMPTSLDALYLNGGAWTAAVHSASWGSVVSGEYDSQCANHDWFAWDNPEFLPVFSAGNSGCDSAGVTILPMTICSPGAAKNVLTVGATQNERTDHDGGWGNGDSTKTALFSSRGPCADGRTKPDIAAPGVGILSTRSHDVDYDESGYGNYDEFYAYDSGTSMSCPLTAGAVTLVRQWLVERKGFDGSVTPAGVTNQLPTAALMKAMIMGGAKGAQVPNNDQGWGRVDLESTLFPSDRAVKLIDRIPFDEGYMTNIVIVTTNAAPLDVQLVWIDYPGSAIGDQSEPRLVNDLDLFVESGVEGVDPFIWGNGGAEADTLNNAEVVRIANAPASTYVISVDCKTIFHGHEDGGAAALYIRGAFDPTVTYEVPKRVHLTKQDKDFFTLDRALAAVDEDGETVTVMENCSFMKPVTVTNSCTIGRQPGVMVRGSDSSVLTASGDGVAVTLDSLAITNALGGIVSESGASVVMTNCVVDVISSIESKGEVTLTGVEITGEGGSDWTVSGKLALKDAKLGFRQTMTVTPTGSLTLGGEVSNIHSLVLKEAKQSSVILAADIESCTRVEVTAPGASSQGSVFGAYLCDSAKAVEVAKVFVNMLDPDGEMGGKPDSTTGELVWAVVEPSLDGAGAILDDKTGTHYFYTFRKALKSWSSDGARITVAADSLYTNAVSLVGGLTLTSTNSAILSLESGAQFAIPSGKSLVITNLTVTGGGKAISDCAFKVTGGSLTLESGAKISGLSDTYKYGRASGGIIIVCPGTFTMKSGSRIEGCTTAAYGSALWISGASGTAVANFLGGTISDCYASNEKGGAVYACRGASVNVAGDFTAVDNSMGSGKREVRGNLMLSTDCTFTMTGNLTGTEVGVSFIAKSGVADRNAEGANFIAAASGVSKATAERITNDTDTDLYGADNGSGTIVWKRRIHDGQCDESEATLVVTTSDGNKYYADLDTAVENVTGDATYILLTNATLTADFEIASDVSIKSKPGNALVAVYRKNDAQYHVLASGALTLSNVRVYGIDYDGASKLSSTIGLVNVEGGDLTLLSGACVGNVYGSASRAANAITVWDGGVLTMESGSLVTNSINFFTSEMDATGCGGAILLDRSTAYLNGGKVIGCHAMRAGGVYVANSSTAYVSGDFTAIANGDLDAVRNNVVIADLSDLVLAGPYTGSMGLNEGIACDTNWFAKVSNDVEWTKPVLASSAANFTHDFTGARGTAVTDGSGNSVLVWDQWLSKAGKFVDDDGNTYNIVLAQGQSLAVPQSFSVAPIKNGSTLGISVNGGVEGCWYTVYATDSLTTPFKPVKSVQLKANDTFVIEIDATQSSQFYKVVAEEGIKGL